MHRIETPTNRRRPPAVLQVDNLDDRGEAFALLARLPPWERVGFMRWACAHARLGPWAQLVPRATLALAARARTDGGADERLTLELWQDCWELCASYEVDLDRLLAELVRRARRSLRR